MHSIECVLSAAVAPGGGGVSQHALGEGVCIPTCAGQGGVYPSMYWAGDVCLGGCLPNGGLPRGVSAWVVSAQGVCLPGECL